MLDYADCSKKEASRTFSNGQMFLIFEPYVFDKFLRGCFAQNIFRGRFVYL